MAANVTVTDPGSSRIVARGFCWNTNSDPKLTDYKKEQTVATTDATGGLGAYQITLTNLTPNTVYYLRAYAINTTDTAYGDEISFTVPVQIGDTLEGGILFYLDSTCHHGMVCAMTDQSGAAELISNVCCMPFQFFVTDIAFGAGQKNTDSLLLLSTIGNAPNLCHNYFGGNHSD